MSEESADIKSGDQTVDDRDRKGEVVFAKNFSFSRLDCVLVCSCIDFFCR